MMVVELIWDSLKRQLVLPSSCWVTGESLCRSTDLSFDLSPLTKADGGFYNLTSGNYDYLINVCDPVKAANCPEQAGACQVEQKKDMWAGALRHFLLSTTLYCKCTLVLNQMVSPISRFISEVYIMCLNMFFTPSFILFWLKGQN